VSRGSTDAFIFQLLSFLMMARIKLLVQEQEGLSKVFLPIGQGFFKLMALQNGSVQMKKHIPSI
jgi:hypothetical protein